MSPSFQRELEALGRQLVWWRARLFLVFGLAIVVGSVWLLGLIDIWMRCGRLGRVSGWLLFLGCVAGTLWVVMKTMRYRYSTQGVAATVEKAFPELDNHLINYVQFSADAGSNPFKTAYLEQANPRWDQVDPSRMKNEKVYRQSWLALALALLLLAAPGLIFGAAWPRALVRMLNPFANLTPISLTHIISVQPGDTTVLQGAPLVLSCSVQGMEGHEVYIEIDPNDARMTRTALGHISSGHEESFARRIPKVTTGFRYRFKAGDSSPSDWQTVHTRPPAAFSDIRLEIRPPEYTGRPSETVDARTPGLRIPQGARVTLQATCNTPLAKAGLSASAASLSRMTSSDDGLRWSGGVEVTGGRSIRLQAEDVHGDTLEEQVGFTLGLDAAPVIEISAPRGRTVLPPGENPRISFRVQDDYGLVQVAVEQQMESGGAKPSWVTVQEWNADNRSEFQQAWTGQAPLRSGNTLSYRVVARDTCSFTTNIGASVTVVFDSPSQADLAKERKTLEAKAVSGLHEVVKLQQENLKATRALVPGAEQADKTQWAAVIERQIQIRQGTRLLIDNPVQPLGKMSATVKKLYLNEMNQAAQTLTAIPQAAPSTRAEAATQAQLLEERILRQLSAAEGAMAQSKVDRRVSGLAAMLAKMIGQQSKNLKETQDVEKHKTRVSPLMVDVQDALASDLTEFVTACTADAEEVRANDAALAEVLLSITQLSDDQKIRNDMMLAAEQLDQNQAPAAIPFQEDSLSKLQRLQALLDGVRLTNEEALEVAMEEGLSQAQEKLARMKDLHKRVLDSMELLKAQQDKSDEQVEMMEEAYEELVKNTRESMLEVPTDLHVFMDLNVANDVVEDVFSVYQEIEQSEESKSWTESNAFEQAYVKELALIESMEEAEGKLDDMEQWLEENPDAVAVTTESFDQEELPESGIALGGLPTELEDLISDLVEETEELADAADDGAVNHSMSDVEMGGPVMEGNITSFAAKGKSGAQTPDHKEQDGRSNVGRQGMSNGETAAGSGTISEGDKNIEERRTADPTQSGQVDLDGEADTKATGGGKLASGKADDLGLSGGVKRLDSNEAGSNEGMAALMAERADSLYAKASMKNIRLDSLQDAAHHLRQSSDAVAKGNIAQVQEHKRLAVSALVEARTDLQAGPSTAYEAGGHSALLGDMVESSPDNAPPQYKKQVAEYFKVLNEAL